jgi:flavin reductase
MVDGHRTNQTRVVDRTDFREAMARLGAAVNIVTTRGPLGDTGFTASAVSSVTDDPAIILVCMNRASRQHDIFLAAGCLCVNILTSEDEHLSPIFSGKDNLPMPERFGRAKWRRLVTGAPALEGAAAVLDCEITRNVEIGTHSVMFCTVQAIHLGNNASGLIYHGRAYHKILCGLA